jgi:hypothetical protein
LALAAGGRSGASKLIKDYRSPDQSIGNCLVRCESGEKTGLARFGYEPWCLQKTHEKALMMIIEEANESKLQDCELRSLEEVFKKDPTRNIIDFESDRTAREKDDFDDEQNRVMLMQRSHVPSRLPEDWLEFLLTVVLFVVLLLGLVGGVTASWQF